MWFFTVSDSEVTKNVSWSNGFINFPKTIHIVQYRWELVVMELSGNI